MATLRKARPSMMHLVSALVLTVAAVLAQPDVARAADMDRTCDYVELQRTECCKCYTVGDVVVDCLPRPENGRQGCFATGGDDAGYCSESRCTVIVP